MKKLKEYEYFSVFQLPTEPSRKTRKYLIASHRGIKLGIISWYSSWRQFVFMPEANTVWSDGCLDDIKSCLKKIKQNYKANKD